MKHVSHVTSLSSSGQGRSAREGVGCPFLPTPLSLPTPARLHTARVWIMGLFRHLHIPRHIAGVRMVGRILSPAPSAAACTSPTWIGRLLAPSSTASRPASHRCTRDRSETARHSRGRSGRSRARIGPRVTGARVDGRASRLAALCCCVARRRAPSLPHQLIPQALGRHHGHGTPQAPFVDDLPSPRKAGARGSARLDGRSIASAQGPTWEIGYLPFYFNIIIGIQPVLHAYC